MGTVDLQLAALTFISIAFVLIKYLNRTDIPKIKNLPEIAGIPLFGNLIQLGDEHARRTREWSKIYGPVFQVRMGNRVRGSFIM
jgi:phenylacetate 2-hydroxylase